MKDVFRTGGIRKKKKTIPCGLVWAVVGRRMPPADFSSTVWIFTKTRSPKGFSVVNFGATEVAAFTARHLREFEAGKNACFEPDCNTEPFVAALRPWNEAIFKCELTADPSWAAVAIAAISPTKWTPQLKQESKKGIRNARRGKHRKQQSQGEAKCVAKKEAYGTRELEKT